jgi:aspartyl-tRNA(Asn)/glutamyl-tRNA(Gln) amidotransferase subunit A
MREFAHLSALEARDLLGRGEVSSVELTRAALDRIVARDNEIKAYLTVAPETALEQEMGQTCRRCWASRWPSRT